MYVDSLNIRRTVPNCPQLAPAIALSVVPTVFGYKLYLPLPSALDRGKRSASHPDRFTPQEVTPFPIEYSGVFLIMNLNSDS